MVLVSDFVEWINGRKSSRSELFQGGHWLPVTDTNLPLSKRSPARHSILLRHALIGLLGTLADLVAVPRELVPPELALRLFVFNFLHS
jgi:hypothetical protein